MSRVSDNAFASLLALNITKEVDNVMETLDSAELLVED